VSSGEGQRTSPLPVEIPAAAVHAFELPGDAVFPESAGVDPATGDAYVGSLADGALYRLSTAAGAQLWSAGGQDGRGSVAGVKVDTGGRLWAAGGYDGTLWVYDLSGRALLARLDVGARPSCVNDIAFGPDGAAYVTDSLVPVLFRAAGEPLALEAWVDLAGQGVPWPDGLNLNGIVLTADARHLVACQTNLGRFWRVELASGRVQEAALDGGPLPHCDGLARSGSTLYVAVNARNLLAVVDLSEDGASGRLRALRSCETFAFPTAVAVHAGQLLVVNGQLDKMGGSPRLPFTVVTLAVAEL
jgi:Cu-Zn family superoxide dismutase